MEFHELPNVISVPLHVWTDKIRPQLMKMSEYKATSPDDDINDIVLITRDSKGEDYAVLPKFFWHLLHQKLLAKDPTIKEYIKLPQFMPVVPCDLQLKPGVEPREYQWELINKVLEEYNAKGLFRGTIKATPGAGKTFMAIYIFIKLNLKPIIVCHNEVLFEQWKEAILNFVDIEEDEIGQIQGSNLKKIKKEAAKKVVLVKSQSLMSQVNRLDLTELYNIYQQFSILIQDEVHTTGGALKFGRAATIIPTPNLLSLSATPQRKGLNKLILESAVGTNIVQSSHLNLIPQVEIRIIDSHVDDSSKRYAARMPQYVQKLAAVNSTLTKNHGYIRHICDLIKSQVKEDRHILVIAANNTMIKNIVMTLRVEGIDAEELTSKNRDHRNAQVIVSNNQMSSTGMSIDSLDTLILCNNNIGKTLLIQSAGRILRLKEGKKTPKMFLIFDKMFLDLVNSHAPFIAKSNLESEYGENLSVTIKDLTNGQNQNSVLQNKQ